MSIAGLDRIFRPERVAVVGASDNPASVGYAVLRNLVGAGFKGVVYPVNPKREAVQGIAAYPSIDKLPKPADLAVICTPSQTVLPIVKQCAEVGTKGLAILSAGFREIGDEGRALEDQVLAEIRKHEDMRAIGPNCLGVIVPGTGLNAAFTVGMPKPGNVAFISQSGALGTSVLDWAIRKRIGFSAFVSVGNMMDTAFDDLIDYFGRDPATDAIMLYIESIQHARGFVSAARAFARGKPIIAYKGGRFAASAAAAASHTGALMGADDIHDAAFTRAGIVRVFDFEDMFDCAELLGRGRLPRGGRLGIVTNAGGPGVMATDALIAAGGELAELSDDTMDQLNQLLPPFWSHRNPVDVLGDATSQRYAETVKLVLHDPNVDALLIILTPQAMTDPLAVAEAMVKAAGGSRKPVVTAWLGGNTVIPGRELLNNSNIPSYTTPERAVDGLMHLVKYARNIELQYEMPREVLSAADAPDHVKLQEVRHEVLAKPNHTLSEIDAKRLLAAAGIPVASAEPADTADRAVEIANQIGYPVVIKILSPDITHKTDVGGVALDLKDEQDLRHAFETMMAKVKAKRPDATVEGVAVQPMIDRRHAVELLLGAKKDPVFGSVILVGAGGVEAELWQDRALGFPPLTESLVRHMLQSLKIHKLLTGFRDMPPVNFDKLIQIIIRFSYLIAESPNIAEVDINPLLVGPERVIGVDARVMTDEASVDPDDKYSHLTVRPYPLSLSRQITLTDGTEVTLRPIRPEDEPIWHEMIAACSQESLRERFQVAIGKTSHDFATRYCYIDYDREMAIVATVDDPDDGEKMLAVGRLVMGVTPHDAEYAILIADAWQGKELGTQLTSYCLEIAAKWGVKRVYARTAPRNRRMIAVFRGHDFELSDDFEEGFVAAERSV